MLFYAAKIGIIPETSKKNAQKNSEAAGFGVYMQGVYQTTRIKSGASRYVLVMSLCHHTQYGLVRR